MNEIKDLDRKWCKLHVATKCSVDDYNMQITHLTYCCDKEEKVFILQCITVAMFNYATSAEKR
jgi:hypothetical protein